MDVLLIKGGTPLHGEVNISGAKNAALPIMMASLLTEEPLTISRVPHLRDVTNTIQLLSGIGVCVVLKFVERSSIIFQACHKSLSTSPPDAVAEAMRASILALGPLLAVKKKACLAMPGGCIIGVRPVDIHLEGLRQMGAEIAIENRRISGTVKGRLHGAEIHLRTISVTGTENLMMAATLAEGRTILHNAAMEPEVVDLARCLIQMGAKISGQGTDIITIDGVDRLNGTNYSVMPDRIEAATYLVAGAISKGRVRVCKVSVPHLKSTMEKLLEAGVGIAVGDDWVEADASDNHLQAVNIDTNPFPGFPTDMQAQFVSLNAVANGRGKIREQVFHERFHHVSELSKMGARLNLRGNTVYSQGRAQLKGTMITASDLRASASLVLAGIVAQGETIVHQVFHIDRGYELIEEKMRKIGANIYRLHTV